MQWAVFGCVYSRPPSRPLAAGVSAYFLSRDTNADTRIEINNHLNDPASIMRLLYVTPERLAQVRQA